MWFQFVRSLFMSSVEAEGFGPVKSWKYFIIKRWKYYFSTLVLSLASLFHLCLVLLCLVLISLCIGGNLLYLWSMGKDQAPEVLKVDVQSSPNPYTAFLASHIPPFFLPAVPKGMPGWFGATTAVSWLWKGQGLGRGGERVRLVKEGVEVELEIFWSDEDSPPSVLIFPPLLRPVPSALKILVETIRRRGGGYETIGIVKIANETWVHEGDVRWMRAVTKAFKEVVDAREKRREAVSGRGGGGEKGASSSFTFDHTLRASSTDSEGAIWGGEGEEKNVPSSSSTSPSPPMSCIAYSSSGTLLMNYLQKYPTRPLFRKFCVCVCV